MNLNDYKIEIQLPKNPRKVKELQDKLTDVTTDILRKRFNKEEYEILIKELEESNSEKYL